MTKLPQTQTAQTSTAKSPKSTNTDKRGNTMEALKFNKSNAVAKSQIEKCIKNIDTMILKEIYSKREVISHNISLVIYPKKGRSNKVEIMQDDNIIETTLIQFVKYLTNELTKVKKAPKAPKAPKAIIDTDTNGLHTKAVNTATVEKHQKQETKRELTKEINALNTKIFKLVNEDYATLATHKNFINATKLQKLNHLKALYKNKDIMYSIVITIKEMSLSVPNNLTQGQYTTIINGVKKGHISKGAVSRLNDDNIKKELAKVNKLLNAKK